MGIFSYKLFKNDYYIDLEKVPEDEKPREIPKKPKAKNCKEFYAIKCGHTEGYYNKLTIHR